MSNPDVQKVLDSPVKFIKRLKIKNKAGKIIPLHPNDEQTAIIETLELGKDLIVCKPRQIGSTTIVAAYLFWKVYTSDQPITVALLSHKIDSVRHILKIFKIFYENLPGFLKKPLKEDSASKIVFHNGASIICASASSKGGLRSFTCSYLLLSEFAFSENAEELKATAVSAVNNGQMIIESTANYFGDPLHLEIETAQRGEANYNYLFFPWYEHSEYVSQPPDDFELSEEETGIKEEYNLTDAQVHWRRIMIHKLGADKFRREYPACLADAYAQAGDAYLTEDDLKYIEEIKLSNERWVAITPVDNTDSYAIGVDVGTGTGADFSVAVVISKMTGQVAGIFRCNNTTPTDLAQEVFSIAQEYNGAKILVENNHVGSVVNQCLQGSNLWKTSDDKFWTTNQNNKRVMFEELKEAIRSGTINMLDTVTLSELRSIKLDKHYNISLTRANGAHADSAVALALAFQALKNVRLPTKTFLPQWIKDRSAGKIVDRQNGSATRRY
tara:strand:+ start:592 stop:2088 length:1497 start_codon:yes stop_codon:yes gene_type:complete